MSLQLLARLDRINPARRTGVVRRISPARIEASGPLAAVGDLCEIVQPQGRLLAEVAAVEIDRIVLSPLDQSVAVAPGAIVAALPGDSSAAVGEAFAGRAVDAMAAPIDEGAAIGACARMPLGGVVPSPLDRVSAQAPLVTGVRTIDALTPIGRGQRIGIFSASGVGKTTLITQLADQIESDRCVLCLVGERGREVETIWRAVSSLAVRNRFTCVAATSDQSAPLRARALHQALALSEYWRERGEHVLLIVDSITRYAMALREMGLATGAPPTLRAYTPNVFAALPRIVERCGAVRSKGSITAIVTVLSETDDVDDPIVEAMKSLLDGHIVLSRTLAEQGVFPAIDPLRSISRQSEKLMTPAHAAAARRAVALLSTYEEARVMIESGVYKPGSNPRIDEAATLRDELLDFLRQPAHEHSALSDTVAWLLSIADKSSRHG